MYTKTSQTFPHSTSLMTSRGVTTWAWRSIHYRRPGGEREREREFHRKGWIGGGVKLRHSLFSWNTNLSLSLSLSRGISRRVIHGDVNPNEFLLLLFFPFSPRLTLEKGLNGRKKKRFLDSSSVWCALEVKQLLGYLKSIFWFISEKLVFCIN